MKTLVLKRVSELHKKASYSINYQQELNEEQYQAVMHDKGPALVIAGAGTGKTRILTYRVARLVEDGIPPEKIVLLTFTRKSATEMLRRASLLLDGRCEKVSGGTFHSYAHSLLRKYGHYISLQTNFSILDQSDSEDAVNLIRSRLQFDKSKKRFPLKQTLLAMYSTSINCCQTLEQTITTRYPQFIEYEESISSVLREYVRFKEVNNLLDYDDLLVFLLKLLEQSKEGGKRITESTSYLMVDEYQDTNKLQHTLVQLLAGKDQNVMAVGDDAQSIYSFRGAEPENIFDFPQKFSSTRTITIPKNYRSTNDILKLSNFILSNSVKSYKNFLQSYRDGQKPFIVGTKDERQQSRFLTQLILQQREEGVSLENMAVLFRSGFMSFDLEIELTKANIPFKKYGGLRFSETAHVKDVLAMVRLLYNPLDIVSWYRVLLLLDGVGPRTASDIVENIQSTTSQPYWENPLLKGGHRGVENVLSLCKLLSRTSSDSVVLLDKVALLAEYYRPILKSKYDDFPKRWRDVETFISIASGYTSLAAFVADMALEPPSESVNPEEEGKENEFLTLSTIHSAKGLEWKTVFLIWALDGRFPSTRSLDTLENIEEERRLFYVAVTRAKDELVITYPIDVFDRESGMVLGEPSRFLTGVDEDIAERFIVMEEQ